MLMLILELVEMYTFFGTSFCNELAAISSTKLIVVPLRSIRRKWVYFY